MIYVLGFLLNDLCFRPHSTSGCFQTGYIVNGEPKFVKSTFCPDSVLAGRTWTKFKVLDLLFSKYN